MPPLLRLLVEDRQGDGSDADFALARYNTDGSLDTSFDGDGTVTTPIGSVRDEVTSGLTERFQQQMQNVLEASRMEFEAERERISFAAALREAVHDRVPMLNPRSRDASGLS